MKQATKMDDERRTRSSSLGLGSDSDQTASYQRKTWFTKIEVPISCPLSWNSAHALVRMLPQCSLLVERTLKWIGVTFHGG